MRRTLVLAIGLLVGSAPLSAQLEIGVDTGLEIGLVDGTDNDTSFRLPSTWARIGYITGASLIIEPRLGFEFYSTGDLTETALLLVPGVNYLLGERFYIRGEVGLARFSQSDTGLDASWTQYGFGGGAGARMALGDSAMLRLEGAADYWLENADDGAPQRTAVRFVAGVSAIIS